MQLTIEFPDILLIEDLINQKKIPCMVCVSGNFEIIFPSFLGFYTDVIGFIKDINVQIVEELIPPGAGGQYIYYCSGLITIKRLDDSLFHIVELSMFDNCLGWCQIIENGQYAEPNDYMKKAAPKEK